MDKISNEPDNVKQEMLSMVAKHFLSERADYNDDYLVVFYSLFPTYSFFFKPISSRYHSDRATGKLEKGKIFAENMAVMDLYGVEGFEIFSKDGTCVSDEWEKEYKEN